MTIQIRLKATPEMGTGKHMWIAQGEESDFKCSKCGKSISEGFLCRERKLTLCVSCESKMWEQEVLPNGVKGMSEIVKLCPHDAEGVHEHIKWLKEID